MLKLGARVLDNHSLTFSTFLPCSRPQKVCLCPYFPPKPLEVSTSLYVVQHPAEVSYAIDSVFKTIIVCLDSLRFIYTHWNRTFGKYTCHLIKSHQSNFNILLNQSASFKKIRTFLIHAVVSGGQGASHCSATCCMFTSRKMQHHSWKKIQWREVDGDPFP